MKYQIEPLELRYRFDFSENYAEEFGKTFIESSYLKNLSEFSKQIDWIESEKLNKGAKFVDFVMIGVPMDNPKEGYNYKEYFRDNEGNVSNYYECEKCPWDKDGLYQMGEQPNLPDHTRSFADGILIYDYITGEKGKACKE